MTQPRPRPLPCRALPLLLAAALLLLLPLQRLAAQGVAAPPPPADAQPEAAELQAEPGDPPALVGRVARVAGTVSFRVPGEEGWRPARPNEPVIAGQQFWAEPFARAVLEFARTRLAFEGRTDLQIAGLDETGLRATMPQGTLYLRLLGLTEAGGMAEVVTPQAVVSSALDGRLLIEAAGAGTLVTVFEGAALVVAEGQEIALGAGEALRLAEGAPPQRERAATSGTPLAAWAGILEPRLPPPAAARGMTGVDALGFDGFWETNPEYGDIWYPRGLPADWVPYADGAWQWREPWGWIWVDAAPWGFVTTHYGRWVRTGPRWGWAPAPFLHRHGAAGAARLARPAWAPALVSFIGGGVPGRPVGWVPLGPREPWLPWFRASPGFVQRVNLHQVPDPAALRQAWTGRAGLPLVLTPGGTGGLDGFANRQAATQVPAEAMQSAAGIRREARRILPAAPGLAAGAALLLGLPPLRPELSHPQAQALPPDPTGVAHAALLQRRQGTLPSGGLPLAPGLRGLGLAQSAEQQAAILRRQEMVQRFPAEQLRRQQQQQAAQAQPFQAEQFRRQQQAVQAQQFQADQFRRQQQAVQAQQFQADQFRRQQQAAQVQRMQMQRLQGSPMRQVPAAPVPQGVPMVGRGGRHHR